MKEKTVWSIIKEFVNSQPIGSQITRQQLLSEVNKQFIENTGNGEPFLPKKKLFSNATVDCIRNMSNKTGYLTSDSSKNSGVYDVSKHYGESLSSVGLRKEYEAKINSWEEEGAQR